MLDVLVELTMLLTSNVLPPVLEFLDVPNDANAPDPSPKALDAPVGDTRLFVEETLLKGFLPLANELSPCLRPNDVLRLVKSWAEGEVLEFGPPVDKEILLLL